MLDIIYLPHITNYISLTNHISQDDRFAEQESTGGHTYYEGKDSSVVTTIHKANSSHPEGVCFKNKNIT